MIDKRIKQLLEKNDLTQTELAKRIDCGISTVNSWVKGNTQPNQKQRKKLCEVFGITEAELFMEPSKQHETDHRESVTQIPVISPISAGDPREYADDFPEGFAEEYVPCGGSRIIEEDPSAFALRIEGDSMSPRYLHGDYIIASPAREILPNYPVIAKINDNEATCKILKETNDKIILIALNPAYAPIEVPKEKVKWLYPVVGMFRKER